VTISGLRGNLPPVTTYLSGVGTFFNRGGGAENIKYKVSFCPQIAKHLLQPIILMRVGSCTFSSHLTSTRVWGRKPQSPEARGPQRLAILGDFLSIKVIHF